MTENGAAPGAGPQDDSQTEQKQAEQVGRNEPCPCGSGKKYKRCHGMNAAPKLSTPAAPTLPGGGQLPAGFDPSALNPEMLGQMQQALMRLPMGQRQRLMAVVQRAMAGKDVSREAAELERQLPPQFKQMMSGFTLPEGMAEQMAAAQGAEEAAAEAPAAASSEMSVEEAKRIVAEAVASGKVKPEEAEELLQASGTGAAATEGGSKFSKFWRGLKGQKK